MAEQEQRDTEGEAQVYQWAKEVYRRYNINLSLWLLLIPLFSFLLEWLLSQMSHDFVLNFVPTTIAVAISGR